MTPEKEVATICEILNDVITYGVDEQVYGGKDGKRARVGNRAIAKALYNAGYRKTDEVTLRLDLGDRSADEIKQIAELLNGEIKKQVAREILNTLNCTPHEYHEKKIKELAKFYGVEIDE